MKKYLQFGVLIYLDVSRKEKKDKALENIKDAITAYLETVKEINKDAESRYVEVG